MLLDTTTYSVKRQPAVTDTKPTLAELAVAADFTKKSFTDYEGTVKGEENASFTENYKTDGTTDTKTTYYYHTATSELALAASANADSYMTKTVTIRGTDAANLKQVAFYTGSEKGEEQIAWSKDYNYNGTSVKTV